MKKDVHADEKGWIHVNRDLVGTLVCPCLLPDKYSLFFSLIKLLSPFLGAGSLLSVYMCVMGSECSNQR